MLVFDSRPGIEDRRSGSALHATTQDNAIPRSVTAIVTEAWRLVERVDDRPWRIAFVGYTATPPSQ